MRIAPWIVHAAAVISLTVSLVLPLAAQKRPVRAEALASYADLVRRYRAGEIGGVLMEATTHDRAWFEAALGALLNPGNRPEQQLAHGWSDLDMRGAILLHTEAVLGGWAVRDELDLHLAIARRLIDVRRDQRLPVDFERRWQLLVAWHLQHELDISALAFHLDAAVRRFPRDGEMALALGSFYEILAWSREPLVPLDTLAPSAVLRPILDKTRNQIREQAVDAFRRALTASPQLEEAHLRLGRVLTELNRFDEALQNLRALREAAEDTRLRYLARLFAADADQRAGRLGPAAQGYRDAAQLYPDCQTPWLGLSTVLRSQGDRAAALAMTLRVMAMGSGCDDPWWAYKFGQAAWRLESAARQLRLEVAR